nr:N-acylglucosamine 2-epimerase isoform X2 [Caretta caretta]
MEPETRALLEAWRGRLGRELDAAIGFWARHSHDPEHGCGSTPGCIARCRGSDVLTCWRPPGPREARALLEAVVRWVREDPTELGRPLLAGATPHEPLAEPMMLLCLAEQLGAGAGAGGPLAELEGWSARRLLRHLQATRSRPAGSCSGSPSGRGTRRWRLRPSRGSWCGPSRLAGTPSTGGSSPSRMRMGSAPHSSGTPSTASGLATWRGTGRWPSPSRGGPSRAASTCPAPCTCARRCWRSCCGSPSGSRSSRAANKGSAAKTRLRPPVSPSLPAENAFPGQEKRGPRPVLLGAGAPSGPVRSLPGSEAARVNGAGVTPEPAGVGFPDAWVPCRAAPPPPSLLRRQQPAPLHPPAPANGRAPRRSPLRMRRLGRGPQGKGLISRAAGTGRASPKELDGAGLRRGDAANTASRAARGPWNALPGDAQRILGFRKGGNRTLGPAPCSGCP